MTLDGHLVRGPTQSRPQWEVDAVALDSASRAAWTAYANALLPV